MRTTVTLEPDLALALRRLAAERGVPFKEALNSTLRAGLAAPRSRGSRPFRVRARPMGVRAGVDLDRALRLAAELEDAEVVRKLELRK